MKFYDFTSQTASKETFDFSQLKGKTTLIVNTASKCGFTGQYAGLEKLYQTYKDKGLVILGYPCDQFAHQEPGSDEQISEFCTLNYGVTFPIMSKIDVNGEHADPLYKWLKSKAKGFLGSSIKWNFTKFLISNDGTYVKRFGSKVEPSALKADIEKLL